MERIANALGAESVEAIQKMISALCKPLGKMLHHVVGE